MRHGHRGLRPSSLTQKYSEIPVSSVLGLTCLAVICFLSARPNGARVGEALVKKGQVEEALELLEDALDAQKLAEADPLLVGHVGPLPFFDCPSSSLPLSSSFVLF